MTQYLVIPSRMALVNIDMQNAFVEGTPLAAPNGPRIIEPINRLAETCRKAGIMVIHTLHVTRADGSNEGTMGELCEPVRAGWIREGSESAKLHPGIKVEKGDILLYKPRYGAFSGTDLDQILRANGRDTIIVTGICTNVCCETTAREAGMRDYHVFFMNDATETFPIGNVSVDEIKRVTHATLGLLFANVISLDEMIARIEKARAGRAAAE
ncbi:MAG: cysteine hydrolase [Alphaproteobacteria bacterium]|nr:cysteine hydrolase [Alphaproteobacteria bacterium]